MTFVPSPLFPRLALAVSGSSCTPLHGKSLIFQRKKPLTISSERPLSVGMVELAGIEPASASLLRTVLHV
jgi:hypothetical protein